jgi:CheY-like chemotaxis protein
MRRTILLADDSTTIRRLVIQTFADADFRIVEVSNGDAAIKMVEEVRPDIVLTDIYMPGKNGYEVCAYIRHHPALAHTPVILLVGAFDAFDEETARVSGASSNITKPFEPGALIDLVKSFMPPEQDPYDAPEEAAATIVRPPALAAAAAATAEVAADGGGPETVPEPNEEDLLGLEVIFRDDAVSGPPLPGGMTNDDIDRIADLVVQRLSSHVIESIAWDIVPEITEKIIREELKRIDES